MNRDDITYDNFSQQLALYVPEFYGMLEEHLQLHGQILPYLLADEFTDFIAMNFQLALANTNSKIPLDIVQRGIAFYDQAITSPDTRIEGVVNLSFLENFRSQDELYNSLRGLLGSRLNDRLRDLDI